jgi:hypothetical protein
MAWGHSLCVAGEDRCVVFYHADSGSQVGSFDYRGAGAGAGGGGGGAGGGGGGAGGGGGGAGGEDSAVPHHHHHHQQQQQQQQQQQLQRNVSGEAATSAFTTAVCNPTGTAVVLGNFESFFTFTFNGKSQEWEDNGKVRTGPIPNQIRSPEPIPTQSSPEPEPEPEPIRSCGPDPILTRTRTNPIIRTRTRTPKNPH